jgi:hypothetical protein
MNVEDTPVQLSRYFQRTYHRPPPGSPRQGNSRLHLYPIVGIQSAHISLGADGSTYCCCMWWAVAHSSVWPCSLCIGGTNPSKDCDMGARYPGILSLEALLAI